MIALRTAPIRCRLAIMQTNAPAGERAHAEHRSPANEPVGVLQPWKTIA